MEEKRVYEEGETPPRHPKPETPQKEEETVRPEILPTFPPERKVAQKESETVHGIAESLLHAEVPEHVKKDKHPHAVAYVCMAASLVLAFVMMIGALCLLSEREGVTVESDADGSHRVVYVEQYGGAEGAMSTPALYDKCIASVVSIAASDGEVNGIGSGFVFREDGYVATANHVIEGMSKITVILSDGTRHEARVIGGDALTDLALLKIEAEGLCAASKGSSAELLPGERVVAIGTPASLDYAGSVSSGEVSYAMRTVKIYSESDGKLEKKMKLIQTNAPVNPGNSGCPLFDGRGQVVGMVTMKLGQNFSGMGFAIPSDGAYEILCAMQEGRDLSDELLGAVSLRAASLCIAGEAFEIGGVYGVRVTSVLVPEGEMANRLQVGDLITQIGEHAVTRASELEDALRGYDPGDSVAITVVRNGQTLTFDVVLGA